VKQGQLSKYFEGISMKTLSAVETGASHSTQHEFNGVSQLKKIFGTEKTTLTARFVWLNDEQEALAEDGFLTWYDARERHATRSEFRLYYQAPGIPNLWRAGDTVFLAKRTDGSAMAIVTPPDSTTKSQLIWLFDLPDQPELKFKAKEVKPSGAGEVDFATRFIFDEIGVEVDEPDAAYLDSLIEKFGVEFPATRTFSDFAACTLKEVSPLDNPDEVILTWMEREEALFRRLERRVVEERIKTGFTNGKDADVDGFLKFSLSVQNRRKSRAGKALEHHLERILKARNIRYERGAETEQRNKPDFLFPGGKEYRDRKFDGSLLTMLGSKSSLKDRWRQILAEAERIPRKHLLTLAPRLSENQTTQMRAAGVQLVVPEKLHETYKKMQRNQLITLAQFICTVEKRQKAASA
jgi:hypothetical protein